MRNIIIASLLLLVSACSHSSREELTKALQSVRSWTATARMVGETWQQGNIPDTYAQQTLAKSQQEITKETQGITIPPTLQQPLQQLHHTLGQMENAVEQKNKSAIAPLLQALSQEQQQIAKVASTQGKQP